MGQRCFAIVVAVTLLTAAAAADTKIVHTTHQDAFTIGGQTQPAADADRVTWLGDGRMRVDAGTTTYIVRLDSSTLFIVDHGARTVSSVGLPIDVARLLPEGMAEQMSAMMHFDFEVTPTDETKQVGAWTARRWNMTMTSPMVTVENALWATTDLEIDHGAYVQLFGQIAALQPGMEGQLEKLRAIDGFVVETVSTTRITGESDGAMTWTERAVSVETAEPPPGAYDPPDGYTKREFDLMATLQRR
ncbi:MAG TPA: hypothetical protein PLS95_08380 [Thermoanaerobaculales bacterium]|nr:hypothetical protein [Thermoanaerobaculales bacterium]